MINKELKNVFRLHNTGDAWGDTMGFCFALCSVLYLRDRHEIPDLMQFRPGIMGVNLDDDLIAQDLNSFDSYDLESFGRILNRVLDILKAKGLDY